MASRIEERISQIIADQLGLSEEEVGLNATLVTDLGADSLDFIELLLAVEEEFGIEISDSNARAIKTVGDLVDVVSRGVQ